MVFQVHMYVIFQDTVQYTTELLGLSCLWQHNSNWDYEHSIAQIFADYNDAINMCICYNLLVKVITCGYFLIFQHLNFHVSTIQYAMESNINLYMELLD